MLDRKDIRAKLCPDLHAQLAVIAECDGKDIGVLIEEVMVAYIQRRVDEATVLAGRLGRLGITGNNRECPGTRAKTGCGS